MRPIGYNVNITKSGYIYIIITILISVGAVNTGNNLLYLMSSLMLALMALSGISSFGNLFFLDFVLNPPQEVFAQIPARFSLGIHKKRGSSFFLSCETHFGSIRLPVITGKTDNTLWLTFPKRGKIPLERMRVHSGFPMGFFRRYKLFSTSIDIPVYPKPMPCSLPLLIGTLRGTEKSDSLYGEPGDEVKDLRDYRKSDPLKWVDWKASARKGQMVVRDFYHLEGDTLTIDLSSRSGGWEKRLSEACYLILEGHRRELFLSLILPDRKIEPGTGEKQKRLILEALADA